MTLREATLAANLERQAPRLSVIICAYTLERWDDLVACVASVGGQTHPPLETLVVVDRCPDLLRRVEANLRGLRVYPNAHHGGLSGSRQTGAEQARGDVLAFLDDDAIADPDWLRELIRAYEDPHVLGAGGAVQPWWVEDRPRWFPVEFDWVVGCSHPGLPGQTGAVRNPIGANMSIRADVLREVGGFNTSLGRTYAGGDAGSTAEETELCIRASRLHPGCRWLYIPTARVTHRVPPERTTVSYFLRRCEMEGRAKAVIAQLEGNDAALEAERAYLRRVLLTGSVRELRGAVRGQLDGLARAAAIAGGALVAAIAYSRTRLTRRGMLIISLPKEVRSSRSL